MPVADNEGVRVAYEDDGEGEPVVFVHGITEDSHSWDGIVPALTDAFRCVRLDLRGHGASGPGPAYDSFSFSTDVAAVIADAGLDAPVVVGHSLGAVAASIHATTAPVAGVVNVDQGMRFGDFAALIAPMEAELRGQGFHDAFAAFSAGLGEDKVPQPWREWVRSCRANASQEVVLGIWATVFETPAVELDALGTQLLSSITAPYLGIYGDELPAGYAEWFRQTLPKGTLEVWEGLGHWVHLVDPDRFVTRIRGFCRRCFG